MKLLLDAHISPAVVRATKVEGRDIVALRDWQDGIYLEAGDDVILRAAYAEMRTLVTYDLRTIPPLLRSWTEQGVAHVGVVLVDERTTAAGDIGALARALQRLLATLGDADWENRVVYLTR